MKWMILTVLGFAFLPLSAQRIDTTLQILDSRFPQEKLYLHFDKTAYNPGETIWFKAYLFSATLPSELSKIFYAELVDDKGKVLQRRTSPVVQSSASSSFDLPADFASSVVYVRGYTRWMLNFDTAFIYTKSPPVNSLKKSTEKPTVAAQPPALQFFPEGGDLVDGIESRVAFKAIDSRGLPVNAKGRVVDAAGKEVSAFTSMHDGMGYFILTPQQGQHYKAIWKDEKGKSYEANLPAAKNSGITLQVTNEGKKVTFSIRRSANAPERFAYVVAQFQQTLLYRASANLEASMEKQGSIPTENLPAGIMQITLFDKDYKPVAERIVFVNQQDYYFITDLNAALKNTEKREKNVIRIDVPDTIKCNLSVSITDAGINPPNAGEEDIFSGVLLTSDIKGYVHNPAYYFSSEADSVAQHLDLVMMTNGWRRFKWEDVLAGKWPVIKYQPDNYLAIRGKVSGLNKSELQGRELTGILQTSNSGRQFVTIPLESDGSFLVPDMLFFDTARLYYQLNNDKDKVLTMRAGYDFKNNLMNNNLNLAPHNDPRFYSVKPDTAVQNKNRDIAQKNITEQRKVQTLATVEVTAKQKSKNEKLEEQLTSGLFTGDGRTFFTEDDPLASMQGNVFSYLMGKVAGLQISGSPGRYNLSWRGGAPALFLDEMQQQDAAVLESIPMSDVAMVKVFNPPFIGGFGGSGSGAIAVYTKKGGGGNNQVKGLDFVTLRGYSEIKQFYSPDYSVDKNATANDFRTTLYWVPFILTDKNNRKIMLTFYNNDVTNRFRVVVEGVNADGKLTRIEKIFE